jgi:hypothetical protein
MKIQETFIVWSEIHAQLVKLHKTYADDGTGVKWFIEAEFKLYTISFDEALELLNVYNVY